MCSAYIVEAHITVNNIAILTVAQEHSMANTSKASLRPTQGRRVKYPIFFSEFNQI